MAIQDGMNGGKMEECGKVERRETGPCHTVRSVGVYLSVARHRSEADSDRQGSALLLLLNGLTGHMPTPVSPTSLSHQGGGAGSGARGRGLCGLVRRSRLQPQNGAMDIICPLCSQAAHS